MNQEKQKITDAFRAADLILRYLHGVLTVQEQIELDTWIEESDENREIFSDMTNPKKLKPQMDEYEQFDPNAGYDRFMKKHFPLRVCLTRVASVFKRYGIAAAIILTAAASLTFIYITNKTDYRSVSVPKNQTKEITLHDGTKVSLNGPTTLTYPSAFHSMHRTVNINGNGYFAVAEDPSKPFYVNVNNNGVKVRGAAFHVNAYAKEVLVSSASFREVLITDSSISLDPQPGQPLVIEGQGKYRIVRQ